MSLLLFLLSNPKHYFQNVRVRRTIILFCCPRFLKLNTEGSPIQNFLHKNRNLMFLTGINLIKYKY